MNLLEADSEMKIVGELAMEIPPSGTGTYGATVLQSIDTAIKDLNHEYELKSRYNFYYQNEQNFALIWYLFLV